jgi:hypothetical protein
MPMLEQKSRVAETVLPRLPVNRELPRAVGFASSQSLNCC